MPLVDLPDGAQLDATSSAPPSSPASTGPAPGTTLAPLPDGAQLDAAPQPQSFLQKAANVAGSLAGVLGAAEQGTSPVVRGVNGASNYQALGKVFDSDAGPAYTDAQGNWNLVDPTKHVILNDPTTGTPTVYARSGETDERLASLGRMLGFGAMAPSPVASPSLAAPVTTAVGNRFGPADTQAMARVGNALKADVAAGGAGPMEIGGALANAGATPLTTMDVGGENLRGLAGQVARLPGPGRQQIMSALNARDADAGSRLAEATNNMTGGSPGGNFLVERALNTQAKTAAAPLYGQAYMAPPISPDIVYDGGALDKLMARPSMHSAATRALSIAKEEGRDPASLGIGFNPAGDPVFEQVPSWNTLDYVKRGLDDVLNGYRDSTTGRLNLDEQGRAIDQTRRSFLDILDQNNPAYAQARAAYSGPQQSRGALLQGAQAFNKDPDEITSDLGALSPGDQSFYRLGAANELKTQLAKTSSGGNEALRIMGNNYKQQQLRAIFPNADQLLGPAGAENTMYGTKQAVLGNSATAARLAQDQSGEGPGVLRPLAEALTGFATHEPVMAAKSGYSALQSIFKGNGAMTPEVGDKIAGALLQSDPMAAKAWLSNAFNRAVPPPVNLRPLTPLVDLSAQQAPLMQGEYARQ